MKVKDFHTHTHTQYSVTDRVTHFIFEQTFLYKATLCVGRSDVSTYSVFICCILLQTAHKKATEWRTWWTTRCQYSPNVTVLWENTHLPIKNKKTDGSCSSQSHHACTLIKCHRDGNVASQLRCSSGSSQWAPGPLVASPLGRKRATWTNVQTRFKAERKDSGWD